MDTSLKCKALYAEMFISVCKFRWKRPLWQYFMSNVWDLSLPDIWQTIDLMKWMWINKEHEATWICYCNHNKTQLQYIPRNMHTVFALLCFVVIIHLLIFPYPAGLLHWHCGNLTIAPVPAKQPWCIWISTSCEFIRNDCITTTKQSTTKPCAYFLGYTVAKHCKYIWLCCKLTFKIHFNGS